MPTYRIYAVGRDGHFSGPPEVVDCGDDKEAVRKAMLIADGFSVEIWDQNAVYCTPPSQSADASVLALLSGIGAFTGCRACMACQPRSQCPWIEPPLLCRRDQPRWRTAACAMTNQDRRTLRPLTRCGVAHGKAPEAL